VALAPLLFAVVGLSVPRFFGNGSATAPTVTQMALVTDLPPQETATATAKQLPTSTTTATETPAPTATGTASATPSLTPVPTFAILTGELVNRVACRYGPGDIYLYRFGLIPGNRIEVRGRVDTGSGRIAQTWYWGLPEFFPDVCWVNARDVKLAGDPASLEVVYPDKVDVPFTGDPRWPAPQNVEAARQGDEVTISWDFFDLPLGERESENSPRYILELWLCRDGQVTFNPLPVYDVTKVSVIDQAGCAEPSHGRVFLAEVHGYVGPVQIKWPPYLIPQ